MTTSSSTTGSTTVFVAAKLRASDGYLSFGAKVVYEESMLGFKVLSVPQEHADYLIGRLMSGLDLYCPCHNLSTAEDCIVEATRYALLSNPDIRRLFAES